MTLYSEAAAAFYTLLFFAALVVGTWVVCRIFILALNWADKFSLHYEH